MKKKYTKIIICAALISTQIFAAVIINEIAAATSDRNLNYSNSDYPSVGQELSWLNLNFDDSTWKNGACPIGFGVPGLATEVNIQGKALTYYVRQKFIVSAADAAKINDLHLHIDYDDGFIAFVNGKEIGRRNMGPKNGFGFHDQISYNGVMADAKKDSYSPNASDYLVEGTNIIAVQVHNNDINNPGMVVSPDLYISASPEIQIVNHSDSWKYFVGYYEPSGGLVDPRINTDETNFVATAWRLSTFDDSLWSKGPGGLGYGDGDDATIVDIRNVALSLYIRQEFAASQTNSDLTFTVDYDDAFVAYLNGHEIARRHIGTVGEAIPYNRPADSLHEAGTPEVINLTNAGQYLITGQNVLAIQVHNANFGSSDMTIKGDLAIAGATENLVYYTNIWSYFIGKTEPKEDPNFSDEISDDFLDWIELYNNGVSPVSLNGWSLTDDSKKSDKWIFPDVTIGAGEYLIILCSGESVKEEPYNHLQTNFKLSKEGEFLALYDNSSPRNFVSGFTPTYPAQDFFHSYGWNQASNSYIYSSVATPGKANYGKVLAGIVSMPVIDKDPGFYSNDITVTITSATQNAEIRYTTNGSEPTETSALYSAPLLLNSTTVLRARTFKQNCIPSKTITRTFILYAYDFVKDVQIVSIVGDTDKSIFKPNGVTSIVGGEWTGQYNLWYANTVDDYNIPMRRGRPYERPVSVEFLNCDGGTYKQIDCGLRLAGAGRHQYQLQDMDGRWDEWTYINKPQFNFFFRSDYGDGTLKFPVIPGFCVSKFNSLRLRAGKNDWKNPFVNDEFARRLIIKMGQHGSKGFITWLYVNGERKAYYNLVQRYDEKFFQEAYDSNDDWDIINQDWYMIGHDRVVEGDTVKWDEMLDYMNSHNLSDLNNYIGATQKVDVVNFADYIILETYGGNWDWPNNNWVATRERSEKGTFRFFLWDCEGCFATPIDTDNFNEYPPWRPDGGYGLNGENCPVAEVYRSLKSSPEFRLLYADRVQKHFFNNGCMTTNNLTVEWYKLENIMQVMVDSYFGDNFNARTRTLWIPQRNAYIFQQYSNENLWPDTQAPYFNQHGGEVESGFNLAIYNLNLSGKVYYTTDGNDPREFGTGAIIGTEYSGVFPINKTTKIKARAYNSGEWSPLCEATFSVTGAQNIVVSEIMYHPSGGSDYEFIELQNVSGDTLNITNLSFVDGITFSFAKSKIKELKTNDYVVVVKSNAVFATLYNTNDILIAGEYEGKLANSGERIELQGSAGETLIAFTYSDQWYPSTDGDGYSLVIVDPYESTNLWNVKEGWRPSLKINGSPGKKDIPEPVSIYCLLFIIYYLPKLRNFTKISMR